MKIFLYGPPGSGKSTLGRALADALETPFCDLDETIRAESGRPIAEIFAQRGEAAFRVMEGSALQDAAASEAGIIALGGGALLNAQARACAEQAGLVVCLNARPQTLLERTLAEPEVRPLLAGDAANRLTHLLMERAAHYASFALRLETDTSDIAALVRQAQMLTGAFRVRGMGAAYDVRVVEDGITQVGGYLRQRGLSGPLAVISDSQVGALYAETVLVGLREAGYTARGLSFPAGEASKTIATVGNLWNFMIEVGIERGSTVIALGGGVTGDMAGFAAATFLRGVAWVNLPTSLLAMVDSSLGGKTGIDLPQAKNLVGAFHAPRLVLADPRVLTSLPERELRGGLAEVLKHGVIGDAQLFHRLAQGWEAVREDLAMIVRRAMALKAQVISVDPYEQGVRQALNLGHTIGHGVELASGFALSHGEAVAIGMSAEARLAEDLGLADAGLTEQIRAALLGLGLPVNLPAGMELERVAQAMQLDKKRSARQVRFALPLRIGAVQTGVSVPDWPQRLAGLFEERGGQA